MFIVDYRQNITMTTGDNGIIDFKLCNCNDKLTEGDKVRFHSGEQEQIITQFTDDGIAKIPIEAKDRPYKGRYCIQVIMKDGRVETLVEGDFERKCCCYERL